LGPASVRGPGSVDAAGCVNAGARALAVLVGVGSAVLVGAASETRGRGVEASRGAGRLSQAPSATAIMTTADRVPTNDRMATDDRTKMRRFNTLSWKETTRVESAAHKSISAKKIVDLGAQS
jgi:hypothetical protein